VKTVRIRASDELAPFLVLRIEETTVAAKDHVQTRAHFLRREPCSYGEPVAEHGPKPA
jgi:hypothetical protein